MEKRKRMETKILLLPELDWVLIRTAKTQNVYERFYLSYYESLNK